MSNITNTNVTVGTSSTQVLPVDVHRVSIIISNISDTDIYLSFGATAELEKGVKLAANVGSLTLVSGNKDTKKLAQSQINAICSVASKKLALAYIDYN